MAAFCLVFSADDELAIATVKSSPCTTHASASWASGIPARAARGRSRST